MEFDIKHPILLLSSHEVVWLYINYMHEANNHQGVECVRSLINHKLFILGLQNALRTVSRRCVPCKKVRATTYQPVMADFPSFRIEDKVHTFANTGMDYLGPLEVKKGRRSEKRWICLFTCLVVRAVHLEVVSLMDTDACVTAIRRFIARRGQPLIILSDNGTTFVGAKREFDEFFRKLDQNSIQDKLRIRGIQWSMNPPAAPYFGGSWEKKVRSCKISTYHVLKKQKLTDDVLLIVTCIVEKCSTPGH